MSSYRFLAEYLPSIPPIAVTKNDAEGLTDAASALYIQGRIPHDSEGLTDSLLVVHDVLLQPPPAVLRLRAFPPLTPSRYGIGAAAKPYIPIRKRTRLAHEFRSAEGASYVTYVDGWEGQEDANGGYTTSTGRVDLGVVHRHRDIFRFGSRWIVREQSTNEIVWAGDFDGYAEEGDAAVLGGKGGAVKADKQFDRRMYQLRDVSTFAAEQAGSGGDWSVDVKGTNSRYRNLFGLVQATRKGTPADGTQSAFAAATFPGVSASRMFFGFQGIGAFGARVHVYSGHYNPITGDVDTFGVFDCWDYDGRSGSDGVADIDLRRNPDFGSPGNGLQEATFNGVADPNFIRVEFDPNGDAVNQLFSFLYDIRINGLIPYTSGSPTLDTSVAGGVDTITHESDQWTVADMALDIAAQLGLLGFAIEPSGTSAIPADFTTDSFASVLDWAALLNLWRWCIFSTEVRDYLDFGPWDQRTWRRSDEQEPFQPLPLPQYSRAYMPFMYPDKTTIGQVRVLADHVVYPIRDYGRIQVPFQLTNPDAARDFGTSFINAMVKPRWGGTAQCSEVIAPDDRQVPAHLLHAGDQYRDVRSGVTVKLKSLRKRDGLVDMTFDDHEQTLDEMVARRELRLKARSLTA